MKEQYDYRCLLNSRVLNANNFKHILEETCISMQAQISANHDYHKVKFAKELILKESIIDAM